MPPLGSMNQLDAQGGKLGTIGARGRNGSNANNTDHGPQAEPTNCWNL
jgi:hypothetical protein